MDKGLWIMKSSLQDSIDKAVVDTIECIKERRLKDSYIAINKRPKAMRSEKSQLISLSIRYHKNVIKQDNCWEWNAAKNESGYGVISYKSRTIGAHRASWLLHKGEIPNRLLVLHHCDNPPCSNPDHLFLGTHKDNSQDAMKKGRLKRNKNK